MPISIQKRWCKMTKRCEIIIRVVDKKGEAPCHHGHVKGMELSWDHDRGRLCPMAQHALFPYIDILRYGGTLPGMKGNRFRVACPDAEVINIFEIEMRTNPSPQKKITGWGCPFGQPPFIRPRLHAFSLAHQGQLYYRLHFYLQKACFSIILKIFLDFCLFS